MRPGSSPSIALLSASAIAALFPPALPAATRPVYGGELRVELRAEPDLTGEVYETLVRCNDAGDIEPWLATSWKHDPEHRQWLFAARPNVTLHNGTTWNPPGGVVAIPDDKPIEQILRDLTRPRAAIIVHSPDGARLGTGPFRLARRDPVKGIRLEAHEAYRHGRPFLDAVEIQTGRALRDQSLDFDLKKTGMIEVDIPDVRRERQRSINIQLTRPVELIALEFENPQITPFLRGALALAVERETMHRVLLDRMGEVTGALLPQWLTGYAFLFLAPRDVARARAILPQGGGLGLAYNSNDPLIRSVADRLAVNAAEAGIVIRAGRDIRLRRSTFDSLDALTNLEDLSGQPPTGAPFEVERGLLVGNRLIPLFHLPRAYAFAPNVRGLPGKGETLKWPLQWEDLWLE